MIVKFMIVKRRTNMQRVNVNVNEKRNIRKAVQWWAERLA